MADSYVGYLRNNRAQTNTNQGSTREVIVETRYIRALPSDRSRWLHVLSATSDIKVPLCEYTKVIMIKSTGGRTYFKVADGASDYVGKSFSLKDEHVGMCLSKTPPNSTPSTLRVKYGSRSHARSAPRRNEDLDQQWGVLTIPGSNSITVTLNSVWGAAYTPIPPGMHRIMVPDAPHLAKYTDFYVEYATKSGLGEVLADQVWFPIELAGTSGNSTRYVHIGNLSEGCVTVYALEQRNAVYQFLISHRLPGTQGKYVANIEVTK